MPKTDESFHLASDYDTFENEKGSNANSLVFDELTRSIDEIWGVHKDVVVLDRNELNRICRKFYWKGVEEGRETGKKYLEPYAKEYDDAMRFLSQEHVPEHVGDNIYSLVSRIKLYKKTAEKSSTDESCPTEPRLPAVEKKDIERILHTLDATELQNTVLAEKYSIDYLETDEDENGNPIVRVIFLNDVEPVEVTRAEVVRWITTLKLYPCTWIYKHSGIPLPGNSE